MSVGTVAARARVPEDASKRRSRTKLAGFAWAALAVTVFSGWFVVTRFSVTHALGVWDITALRFGIGTVILAPALLGRGRCLPPGAWRNGLLFALLWGAPFVLLVAFGLRLTSAAEAASIAPTLMPVLSGLMAWALLRHRPGRSRLFGYAAIVAGLSGLTCAGPGPWPSLVGVASLVMAAAMWAVYTLRFRASGLTPIQSAALICFWSAAFFLPAYLLFGLSRMGEASLNELAFQAAYQGVLMSAVAIVAFNRAVALLGPGAATAIIALLPVIASTIAIPVLGEVPTPADAVAIIVIVVGVMLAARPAPIPMSSETLVLRRRPS